MSAHPWSLFATWMDAAGPTEPRVPEAMQVATVDTAGWPDIRTVLLKSYGADGLVFYTNYQSAKAAQLDARPHCGFLLHFKGLERQIRGRGRCVRTDDATSDAYFASRDRGSQLGAWASPQSRPLTDRAQLQASVAEVEARFAGQPVPRPPFWGGYRIHPVQIEFWQGHPDRLHERTLYTVDVDGRWTTSLLAP